MATIVTFGATKSSIGTRLKSVVKMRVLTLPQSPPRTLVFKGKGKRMEKSVLSQPLGGRLKKRGGWYLEVGRQKSLEFSPGEGKVSQTIVVMSVAYNIWVMLMCGATTAAMKKAVLCTAKFYAQV